MWYYFKTILLIGVLTSLFLFLGKLVAGEIGMYIALIIALAINFISYYFSDKIVLSYYKAQEINSGEIYDIVKEVAFKAGIPTPRVYIIDEDQPNAFATGRNPSNSAVAITTGLINLLNYSEIRGVVAHEIAHIKNRDILISTIAAGIASAINFIIDIFQWTLFFKRDEEDNHLNIFSYLLILILGPLIALIIQMAVSRTREYLADETGAKIINDPISLAKALEKLNYYASNIPLTRQNLATNHLFIVNAGSLLNLFSTHPPIEERIKRLYKLAGRY
jgi:heat shock protein HtpX